MVHLDATPIVDRNGRATTVYRRAGVAQLAAAPPPDVLAKHTVARSASLPLTATLDEIAAMHDGDYDTAADLSDYPGIDRVVFRLIEVDLRSWKAAVSPEEFVDEMDWDDEEEREAELEMYEALQTAIECGDEVLPGVAVSGSGRRSRLLDGNHRASLALNVGYTHGWVYYADLASLDAPQR